jgi:diguanylate cyclase
MIEWSLLCENIALILTLVVMLFFRDKQQTKTSRRRLFWWALAITALAILADIGTVMCNTYHAYVPISLNYLVNVLFFVLSVLMSSAIAYYLCIRVLEFVHSSVHLNIVRVCVVVITLAFLGLVVSNFWTSSLFYFTPDGVYARGPLNPIMYAQPILYVLMFLICYFVNRRSVSQASTRIVRVAPLVVTLLVIVQILYPEQLLNGMMASLVNLIAFLSYQSARTGRDSLTGLQNRQSFFDELPLRAADKQGCQIIVVALRDFAAVNEMYGHRRGDQILFRVAEELRKQAEDATVYRYNNMEFLLLMPGGSSTACKLRLNSIRDFMDRPWQMGDTFITIPAVVAELSIQGRVWTSEQIVNYLDYTVQLAKDESRPVLRFDAETAGRREREEFIIKSMQKAIDEGSFEVWYQPVFYREPQRFVSAEALIRLAPDGENYISPEEFIPLAERAGLLSDISWIVLETTCELLGSGRVPWLESVSANLSIRQLTIPGVIDKLKALLTKYEIGPSRLKIEVTERSAAEDEDVARNAMNALCDAGFGFLLDDFGTGYSNFMSVLDLPFETVKLDKSIVAGLADDARSRLTLSALVPFFHKLEQNIVAEGIETATQAQIAFDFGVDRIQGYYFSRPLPADKLPEVCNPDGTRFGEGKGAEGSEGAGAADVAAPTAAGVMEELTELVGPKAETETSAAQ